MGKSYILFFLLAVVGIKSFCEQELRSHFSCWQLLVYKVLLPRVIFSFFLLAVVGIQVFMGKSNLLIFSVGSYWYTFEGKSYILIFSVGSCWYTNFVWARVMFSFFLFAVVVIKNFMGKSYVLIFPVGSCWYTNFSWPRVIFSFFSVGSCWYTKFLWPRVIFSFFLLAVVGIQSFYGQELSSHFFCWQLLVYKDFTGKSYLLIFSVGSCWYTKFYGQELRSHFYCWQLLVYKVFMGKSYVLIFFCWQLLVYKVLTGKSYLLIFSVRSCWYTKFLWARVTFSFFLLAVVGIQSFYGQELRSHFSCWQLLVYKVFMGKSYVLIFPVGSCWYTKFLWARVTFSFFLLAVVGIQTFHGQELSSHFFCW